MLNCNQCAYKGENPGNAHIRCRFDWRNSELKSPTGNPRGVKRGWWIFPLNYDPVWGDECTAFATAADEKMIVKNTDPLFELAALLASVGR